jgi:hypothetical protein
MPTSEAGLAKGRPTQLPELLGVNGGVGLPGTGLWWKGTTGEKKLHISSNQPIKSIKNHSMSIKNWHDMRFHQICFWIIDLL